MSTGKHRIHYAGPTEIRCDMPTLGVLLLNSGVHPDYPREQMLPYGYSATIEWEDGSHAPGVAHPMCLWYIETPDLKVLVDTGGTEETTAHANAVFKTRQQGQFYVQRPEDEIHEFLARHGTRPEEIDLVFLTHMHLDHFAAAPLYTNARFVVHTKELAMGLAPAPYLPFHWREFTRYITPVLDQVTTVDGDVRICDGVEAWHVGGHSPGLMVVAVDTAVGKVVVGGDFYNTYVNLENDWPVGLLTSLEEWERSSRMLKTRADVIVPGHDYEVWERHPGGTIG